MRALRRLLLVVVGIVLMAASFLGFFCYSQISGLTKVGQATPQALPLAELLDKGADNNAHVRLSDFTFGTPLVEERDGYWLGVWLPLEPTTPASKKTGPVVVWAGRVANEQQLQDFIQHTTLDLLCASRLPDSSQLRVRPGKTIQAAYPKTELSKVTVLVEPVFVLPEGTVLGADVLFNSRLAGTGGWLGFGTLILSGFCLWRGCRTPPHRSRRAGARANERPTPPPPPGAYTRLARERELSLHPFAWRLVLERVCHRGGYLLLFLGGAGFFIYVAVRAIVAGQPGVFLFGTLIALFLFYFGLFVTFMSVGALLRHCNGFAVYSSGIRWQVGDATHAALWEDIAELYRAEVRCFRNGVPTNTFSTMTLKLYDGRVLKMSADTYGNFECLADNVASAHGGWMGAVKRHELAAHGQATFGPVTVCEDGLALHGTFYPWGELEKYEIENGTLTVFRVGTFFFWKTAIPLMSIPNSSALLSLLGDLNQVIRGRRRVTV
jgi:hypothetical protein